MEDGAINVVWWMISITLMFFGVFFFIINPVAGLIVVADSILVLPLTRDRVGVELSDWEVTAIGVGGLVLGFVVVVVAPNSSVAFSPTG